MPSTEAPPAVLEIEDATRCFEGEKGIFEVGLSVRAGAIYGLLGPNGAGKTSLIRAICGRLRLEAGRVRLAGADPAADREARRHLGLVPQQVALYEDLTVRENLEVLGALAGVARGDIAARVAWGLERADLADRARDRVGTLSGGMRRRLNLVAGALHRPRVLLLDEPTAGVDPDARLRVHAMLEQLRDDGMALLLTTHDLDEAARLSDRIGFLVGGHLRAEGTLDELVARTFDGAQHLEVVLAGAPEAAVVERLEGLGLHASRDPARWLGLRKGGLGTLGAVEDALREAGATLRRATLVEPGLREVFLHVTGRELDR